MTWLITRLVGIGIPERIAKPLIFAVGALLLVISAIAAVKHHDHTIARNAVEADRSTSNAAAVSTARQADERAVVASSAKSDAIEKETNDARQAAAADSDDPLRAGLNSLRSSSARRNR